MFASIFCWDTYYYSYLQVVHDQNIRNSGYILNAFSLTSSFISPFIGFLISRTGDFKFTAFGGIPFVVLGTALLIHLRTPSTHVGLLVMCQVFNGIGSPSAKPLLAHSGPTSCLPNSTKLCLKIA